MSDTRLRQAKPAEKPYKLYDSGGLYAIINPNGGKWWRLKYKFEGKEKTVALGTCPSISLKQARELRDSARKLLATGWIRQLRARMRKKPWNASSKSLRRVSSKSGASGSPRTRLSGTQATAKELWSA